MATTTRPVPAARPDRPGTATTLELPETWSAVDAPAPALAAFSDGRSLSPAIETNIVLTAADPGAGGTLTAWQAAVREERLASLPDLQILEERSVLGAGGEEQWHTSAVLTDPQGVTLLVRTWSLVREGTGLTLSLTTLPLVDAEHGAELDRIAATWTPAQPAPERTPDADA